MDPGLDRGGASLIKTLRGKTWWIQALLWLLPLIFLGVFYFFPMWEIITLSFSRSEAGLFSTFIETLSSTSIQKVLGFTLWQALLSTFITLLVGMPAAYLFARFDFKGKTLLKTLSGIPFMLPTLVVAAAFNSLLGPRGWINLGLMSLFDLTVPPIHLDNSLGAILIAHVFYNTTIVMRMVGDFWTRIDPRIEGAAQVLGARKWQTWWKVTLPLLLPAVSAAALLAFIFNFTSFGVILILGGPGFATIEVEIFYQTISLFNLPVAATLSIIQLLITLSLSIIYTKLTKRISQPLSQSSQKTVQRPIRTKAHKIFAGLVITYLVVLFISPIVSLAVRSFTRLDPERRQRTEVDQGFTLDFYRELSINENNSLFYSPPIKTILNSLGNAGAAVVLSLLIGLPASWALARYSNAFSSKLLDPILMLPLGTSAVTLGLGFIVALNEPPLDLRTSPLLIPFAHALVAFPFVVRSLTPALRSIQPNLRQVAAMLGASPRKVMRYIDLPLVGRALLVSAVFAFTISMGEFGATALISRPENPTIPIAIYKFLSQPGGINYGQALALSTILMFVTTTGLLFIERFRIAEVNEF